MAAIRRTAIAVSLAAAAFAVPAAASTVAGCTTQRMQLVGVGAGQPRGCAVSAAVNPPVVHAVLSAASPDATGVVSAWICRNSSCQEVARRTYLNGQPVATAADVDRSSDQWPYAPDFVFFGSYDGGWSDLCGPGPVYCLGPEFQVNTASGVFRGALVTG